MHFTVTLAVGRYIEGRFRVPLYITATWLAQMAVLP